MRYQPPLHIINAFILLLPHYLTLSGNSLRRKGCYLCKMMMSLQEAMAATVEVLTNNDHSEECLLV